MFHTLPEPVSAMHATTLPHQPRRARSSGVLGLLSQQADSDAVLAARSGAKYLRGLDRAPDSRVLDSRKARIVWILDQRDYNQENRPGNGWLTHSCIHKSTAGVLRTFRECTCGRESCWPRVGSFLQTQCARCLGISLFESLLAIIHISFMYSVYFPALGGA